MMHLYTLQIASLLRGKRTLLRRSPHGTIKMYRKALPQITNGWITALALSLIFLSQLPAYAVDRIWTNGSGDGKWSTAANWSPAAVPGSADRAVFNGTSSANCTINVNPTIQGIVTAADYGGTIFQGSSRITTSASFAIAGAEDFDAGNGLIVATGNTAFNSAAAVYNLELAGYGSIYFERTLTVLGNLTISSVNRLARWYNNWAVLQVHGDVITNDADGWNDGGFSTWEPLTISLVGNGDQTIRSSPGATAFLTLLDVSKGGGNVLLGTDLAIGGSLSGTASAHIRSSPGGGSKLLLHWAGVNYQGDVENLVLANNGNIYLQSTLTVLGNLTINAVNQLTRPHNYWAALWVLGDVITNDADGWNDGGFSTVEPLTIILGGNGDQSLSGTGKIPLMNIHKASGKVLMPSPLVAGGFTYISVTGGVWDVSGASVRSTGGFASAGGKIIGTGTLNGAVTCSNGGGIAPGNGAGCLTINGNLSMGIGSTLTIDIADGDACTNYDQLVVNGTANVSGATLVGGTVSRLTAPIKILENDGTDNTSGTFASALNNATITLGGIKYLIKYNAGNNDITLEDPNPNKAPTAACKPITIAANGPNCTATVNAQDFNNGSSDPEGGNLTYSVLPAGPYAVGTTSVTLTVTDPLGASSSCQTTITVQSAVDAPTVNDASNSFTYTGNPQTASATVSNGVTVQYFSAPSGGDPVSPVGTNAGTYTYYAQASANGCINTARTKVTLEISKAPLTIVVDNKTRNYGQDNPELTANVTGFIPSDGISVTYSTTADKNSEANEGGYPITATLVDPNNKLANYTVSNTPGVLTVVGKANQAPVAMAKVLVVSADANCQGTVTADAFNNGSSDPDGDALTFSVSPAGPYAIGVTNVVVTVMDARGASSSVNTTITVEDKQAPGFTAPADRNVSLQAGCSFTVPDLLAGLVGSDNCSEVSFTQSPSAGTLVSSAPNQTHTVTITAKDEAGNTTEKTVTLMAKDERKPVVVVQSITVQLDASGKASITAAQVNNGSADNCTDAVSLKLSLSKLLFDCSNVGANTVTLTVTDASGNSAEATATVTVEDKLAPVITTNGDKSLGNDAGKAGALVVVSASATDNCAVGQPIGVRSDGKALDAEYLIGTTTITWTVTDGSGNAAKEVIQTVTVTNQTPVITAVSASLDPTSVNTAIGLTVAYTDNNVTKATIKWGDGQTQDVLNPASSFTTPHTYTSAGVYTVKVTLTDAGNEQSAEYGYQYIVVYDPDGGFVTGGGWILSPAGAYGKDPAASGKANFGFVSKYQKGANVPTGNTNFEFKAGNLNFKSTSYQWLVVAGAKAQFKGEGTINGGGTYGFILTSVDGQMPGGGGTDKFRIKIWDKSAGDAVVYDNNKGAVDDAEPATALGGGSIVIHNNGKNGREAYKGEPGLSVDAMVLRNYPNPVEGQTTFELMLPLGGEYSLEVQDLKGWRVAHVQAGKASAGELIRVSWEASHTPAGLYIGRLTTQQGVKAIKVLVR